ncbi:MAG: nucleotidyltransferase domain-containing protein [Gammaproteobacteria bacterium]
MNEHIRTLLSELKTSLSRLYGRRLQGVYLYGSYARGEEDDESDLDILIVLDRLDRYAAEVDRTSHLAAPLSLEHGVTVTCVFTTREQWLYDETMFFINVREEAIPA